MRPDQRAQREPGRQRRHQPGVAGAGHIAVQHAVRRRARPSRCSQVHQQEGEVVADVDRGQRLVEFQRVEGRHAGRATGRDCRRCRSPWQRRTRPAAARAASSRRAGRRAPPRAAAAQAPHRVGRQAGGQRRAARCRPARGACAAGASTPGTGGRRRAARRRRRPSRPAGPASSPPRAATASRKSPAGTGAMRSTQSTGLAVAAEPSAAVRRPRDRHDVAVEVRGEAAVDRQFAPREALARRQAW